MSVSSIMLTAEPSSANGAKPRLACPFFRYNPCRHYACASYELKGFEAVKKHLERKHILKNHCSRCFKSFDNEETRNEHIMNDTCTLALGRDEITYSEWTTAKRCPRTSSCEVKWKWLWTTFFNLPVPPRELVYFQDAVAEAKRILIDLDTIQSVLKTRLPLNQQDMSSLADEICEALMRDNSGARPYRAYYNSEGSGDNNGPYVGLGASLGLQSTGTEAVETKPADPKVDNFALMQQQQALLQEEARPPTTRDPSAHSAMMSSTVATLPTDLSFSLSSALHRPAEPGVESPGPNILNIWRTAFVIPWGTADGALARLMEDPISWFRPDGPKWSDVYDHIDRDALRQFWKLGSTPAVEISIPIRPTHIQSFAAIESKLHDFEGTGESTTVLEYGT
ncbi:hypothetical protein QBC36DRAFT_33183 [Triangularia setosa]|uniref:C2H2-type domain-containing protein n=1 Tax=Triangularia setosa TaxID=2587417 RepID=A0AAN7A5J5_9PEZI|nr:hypothetical protein QBC36DRAFT_33183 [Podospora setosa]